MTFRYNSPAIDNALGTAVFESVNIQENGEKDSSVLVNKALDKLQKFLTGPPEEYEIWIEISGLDTDSLPDRFGEIRFVVFDEDQMSHIKTKSAENQQEKTADTEYPLSQFFVRQPSNRSCESQSTGHKGSGRTRRKKTPHHSGMPEFLPASDIKQMAIFVHWAKAAGFKYKADCHLSRRKNTHVKDC